MRLLIIAGERNGARLTIWCHSCGEAHDRVVEIGEGHDSEFAVRLCADCLRDALALLDVK